MSETIFRKVLCSDRLPKERKWFDTDKGYLLFSITQNQWLVSDEYYPKWWLEEIELPSEEDINELANDFEITCAGSTYFGYRAGFNKAIELIKGQ